MTTHTKKNGLPGHPQQPISHLFNCPVYPLIRNPPRRLRPHHPDRFPIFGHRRNRTKNHSHTRRIQAIERRIPGSSDTTFSSLLK